MGRTRTTEGPLIVYGANPVLELLRSGAPVERVLLGEGPRQAELRTAARERGVPVAESDRATLARAAGGAHHQGAVAVSPPFSYAPLERVLSPTSKTILVLDGIQDPRNLGAILRTARAAGVEGVVMPRDRSVGVTPVVATASAGLIFGVPIARVPNLVRALEQAKRAGFWVIGLVPTASQALYGLEVPPRPALVVGGEGEGLRALVRRACDFLVSLPMAAGVESLNVAVATGIALYEIRRQRASL